MHDAVFYRSCIRKAIRLMKDSENGKRCSMQLQASMKYSSMKCSSVSREPVIGRCNYTQTTHTPTIKINIPR